MAFRGIDDLAAEAVVENDLSKLAERALSVPNDAGARLRALVVAHHDRARSLANMRALVFR